MVNKSDAASRKTHVPSQGADNVQSYLREIGRVRLLRPDEEIELGRVIREYQRLFERKNELEAQLGRIVPYAEVGADLGLPEGTAELRVTAGERAKKRMIEANLRLVVSIAKKYHKARCEFLDLIQEGSIGLIRGAEKFDPTKGYKFSTYAYWWIRQGITRAIAEKSRAVRLPVHVNEKLAKMRKAERELLAELGRAPSKLEIRERLGVSATAFNDLLELRSLEPKSLETLIGESADTELGELIADEAPDPMTTALSVSDREAIEMLLRGLSASQAEVLRLRFGLDDGKAYTLAQIGSRMHLSRERVRQIERQGLQILRTRARRKDFGF